MKKPSDGIGSHDLEKRNSYTVQLLKVADAADVRREMDLLHDRIKALEKDNQRQRELG